MVNRLSYAVVLVAQLALITNCIVKKNYIKKELYFKKIHIWATKSHSLTSY